MMPFGAEGFVAALKEQVPALPIPAPAWEWAVGGATGAGVRVAIIDSGIDATHPDVGVVAESLLVTRDEERKVVVLDDVEAPDVVGHGTACAAIIRGHAPDVELVSLRVLDGDLKGNARMFATALEWAMEHDIHVVNLSLSTTNDSWFGGFHELADEAYFKGMILVGALNNVPRPSYPTDYASVVSVASLPDNDAGPLAYNPHGPAEFAAPGLDVRVAWQEQGYATVTGNSFAAPYVAGLVAAMRSKHPWLKPFQVKAVLQAMSVNARPTDGPAGSGG
jgi:subtilisin